MACAESMIRKAVEYAKKHDLQKAAKKFGVSADTVALWRDRKKKFGNPAIRFSHKEIAKYAKEHPEQSYNQIGEVFGIYKSSVAYHCRAAGYSRKAKS